MASTKNWIVVLILLLMAQAHAGEAPRYRQISFQVERSEAVSNDRMQVLLVAQAQGGDPARLAQQVNESMDWALAKARGRTGLTVATGNYQTYPIHVQDRVKAWRALQELRIEGSDIPAVSTLVGELQGRLQVKTMGFFVSDDARRRTEEALMDTALEAFQTRARRIQAAMGASGYDLVNASIQTGGRYPGPEPMMRAQLASVEMAAPVVESGESRIQVTVSGTIELQLP